MKSMVHDNPVASPGDATRTRMKRITIHLICNAHIDPVWLWPWTAGLDEVINTCSSVCDLLERNPDVVFTRGEAWVYEQVERIDPRLFARIRRLVRRGQWEVTGGWYIQPDCNLPHEQGLRKQVELGREYFLRALGRFPRVAYNVDSFGHSAALPGLMARAGQRYYVMMRPQEHELPLPSRLFRWRGHAGGAQVLTFRIAGAYTTCDGMTLEHVRRSLSGLPRGIRHTMCFFGIGDHGGGPTQELIDWCRANRDALPGARLEFSSPSRFFRAVSAQAGRVPLVTGELQHHAIGCYSVHRAVKLGVRRAEHALIQAQEALRMEPRLGARYLRPMKEAWKWLCFNHFHDTMGGSCLPSSYAQSEAQLGFSQTVADDAMAVALRSRMVRLPRRPQQRMVVANYSGADFSGWVEHEPWMEWTQWKPDWGLVDERGRPVPHQVLASEAVHGDSPRLLFKLRIRRGEYRVLRIVRGMSPCGPNPAWRFSAAVRGRTLAIRPAAGAPWKMPRLALVEDTTDTWSHGADRYGGRELARARWGAPRKIDDGPLLCSWLAEGRIGRSRLWAEIRRYAGEAFVEVRLRVTWLETCRLLRLAWGQPARILHRDDGVSGGTLRRPSNGLERPVHDHTLLRLADGSRAGAVFPDTYSLSSAGRELRLTLLRSAVMAHDFTYTGARDRQTISDRGVQPFTFRFYPGPAVPAGALERDALALHRGPRVADLTRGMPVRAFRKCVSPAPRPPRTSRAIR